VRDPILCAAVFLLPAIGLSSPSCADPPRARLTGAFWWVSAADAQRAQESWRADLDAIQALGMDLLIVSGVSVGNAAQAAQEEPAVEPFRAFFAETDRRGLRVFINTLSVANWWTLADAGPEMARADAYIRDVARVYGARESFYGWYVPYELYVFWGERSDLIRTLYREVAACCKAALDKPVMISPFFILDEAHRLGDFRWASPEEYREFWTGVLRQAPIDIVALQDSGEHLSCYTIEERRPFFEAMKAACDAAGKSFWANIETGELEVASLEEYVARFGLKTHVNDPKTAPYWRGVPAAKLEEKLEFAGPFTSTAITWGYQEYIRPTLGPDAQALYDSYAALGWACR